MFKGKGKLNLSGIEFGTRGDQTYTQRAIGMRKYEKKIHLFSKKFIIEV